MSHPVYCLQLSQLPATYVPLVADHLSSYLDGEEGILATQEFVEQPGTLQVFVNTPDAADWVRETVMDLLENNFLTGTNHVQVSAPQAIQDEDWANAWKAFWDVTPVTPQLTIQPSWIPYSPKSPEEKVIILDPGAAFGTGAHDTTRLMLQGIDTLATRHGDLSQQLVLDVGTGSGILAIACAKLGCRQVVGIDVDPVSVEVAQENAERNQVADKTTFSDTPLDALCRTPQDIILMNITANVILPLLPEAVGRLALGGSLLLSGFVGHQVDLVREAVESYGLHVETIWHNGNDWHALLAHKSQA